MLTYCLYVKCTQDMYTLRYVSTNICGRLRNSASMLCTLNKLVISFKYITNMQNSDHAYALSKTYVRCTLHASYAYVNIHYMSA